MTFLNTDARRKAVTGAAETSRRSGACLRARRRGWSTFASKFYSLGIGLRMVNVSNLWVYSTWGAGVKPFRAKAPDCDVGVGEL